MKHAINKAIALLLAVVMVIGVFPAAFAAPVAGFTDVDDSKWYAEFVQYVVDNELMNGTSATTFEPEGTCTRAMAATVLYRIEGQPTVYEEATFTDLDPNVVWYQNAIAWAQDEGVVNGITETTFVPNGLVTREQLVTMIWRYKGEPTATEEGINNFPDAADVSNFAKKALNWAIEVEIINGKDGNLVPKGNATRAEFAKIISVFHEMIQPCEEHTWGEGVVTTEATCTEAGVMTYTCERCDETKEEEIPALGHAWNEGEITTEATCTVAGVMTYTCDRCGETKEEEIPAIGHNFVDGICENCGEQLADSEEIVIYYTNDVHTYIDNALSYADIAELKAQTAAIAAGVLLVDAGDHIQGTAYGAMDKGATIIELMNAAKYDAATLGNHEFDYGMERALEIVEEAEFPYVSANFYHEADGVRGETVLDAYKVFEVGGKKIAIVGITTPETFTKSTPKYFQDENGNYIYGISGGEDGAALYADVQAAIDAAAAEGVDYIIALAHMGDDPSSMPWTSEEVIANTTGLDAFIDGHSHSEVPMKEVADKNGDTVVLTQTGNYFDAIGRMSITEDGISAELITESIGVDADVKAIIDAWVAEVDEMLNVKIADSEVDFRIKDNDGNRMVRKQETNLGDFAADALYYLFDVTEELPVDVAIMNGGGIRADHPAGDVTYKTCKTVHTFGNVACLMTITGQQLLDALEWGAKDVGVGENGGFLQVSGITYEIHSYIPSTVQKDDKGVWVGGPTDEYRVKNVTVGGEPLNVEANYNLAGYNYTLRDLGDGFGMFDGATLVKDYVLEDYMVLANYAQSFPANEEGMPVIKADNSVLGANYGEITGEGRITIVSEKPEDPKPGNRFVLTQELNEGDEIIIVCASRNVALSANYPNGSYYNAGVEVAPVDGVIENDDATIVWTVGKEGDFYTLSYNGQMLGMGTEYTSMTLGGVNYKWQLQNAATEGAFYFANLDRDPAQAYYMQWREEKGTWSGYHTINEELFALNFYVKSDAPVIDPPVEEDPCEHANTEIRDAAEATCEDAGYTGDTYCTDCGEKIASGEEIAALGHNYVDGICSVCGAEEPAAPEYVEYILTAEIAEGDKVVIYNDKEAKVMGEEEFLYEAKNKMELTAVDATVSEDTLTTSDAAAVLTVGIKDGHYTFINEDGKYLYADGTDVKWVDEEGDNTLFDLEATEGGWFIKCTNAVFNEKAQYIEIYSGYFTCYGMNTSKADIYTFNFYKETEGEEPKPEEPACEHANTEIRDAAEATCEDAGYTGDTYCTDCGEKIASGEEIAATGHDYVDGICSACGAEEPAAPEYVEYILTTEIAEGDKVVIYNDKEAKVMGEEEFLYEAKNKMELTAVDATVSEDTLTTSDAAAVLTVGVKDGHYTFVNEAGKYLYADGTDVKWVDEEGDHTLFDLESTEGGWYIKCTNAVFNEKAQYIEIYSGYFTCYGMNTSKADIYTFNFYKETEGEEPKPEEPACEHANTEIRDAAEATCEDAGYTGDTYCTDCGEKIASGEEIAAIGHIYVDGVCSACGAEEPVVVPPVEGSYVVADSIEVGDKIVIVAAYNEEHYAVSCAIDPAGKALDAVAVEANETSATVESDAIVWEVCAGSVEGTYVLKSSEGKYLAWTSGTTLSTGDEGANITITVGYGTSALALDDTRAIAFRRITDNNTGDVSDLFRGYNVSSNLNNAEYSFVITIYKEA